MKIFKQPAHCSDNDVEMLCNFPNFPSFLPVEPVESDPQMCEKYFKCFFCFNKFYFGENVTLDLVSLSGIIVQLQYTSRRRTL